MTNLKITRIRIENFRKFREPLELNLTGPAGGPLDYVVLAGPNGCGKTTILNAILLALGEEDLFLRDLPPSERKSQVVPSVPEGAEIVIDVLHAHLEKPMLMSVRRTATSHELWFPHQPTMVRRPYTRAEWGTAVEYISSRRMPALVGPIQEVTHGRPPDSTEANRVWLLKNRILQQQGRRANPRYSGPEPTDKAWLAKLNDFWHAFRKDSTSFALDVVDSANLDVTEWDLFLFNGPERICSVDALSSGELEVIAMASPFITREFDGLLLFDEPELHMHPEWQGSVVRAVRKLIPAAQVVVATHADDPWDDAFSFQRFLLVPDTDPRSEVWRRQHMDEGEE